MGRAHGVTRRVAARRFGNRRHSRFGNLRYGEWHYGIEVQNRRNLIFLYHAGYATHFLDGSTQVMAQKIAAAADHGIDAFIFDWYYYDDGPFLERPIDEGFLKATNNHRLKFAFMWANHDWLEIPVDTISGNTPERFREALQKTKERLLAHKDGPRILNINCWNEWTEGSYLEPDTVHGMKYLEAVKDVFPPEVHR